MQVTVNIPDDFPQEIVSKILEQFERQIDVEKNLIKTRRLGVSASNNATNATNAEQEDKLMTLRSALIEGENSGVAENYSLEGLLVKLDNESLK